MIEIAAGIVLYNPENATRTQESVDRIAKQVSKLYIFDNSTISTDVTLPKNTIYLSEGANRGIAHALNSIMKTARNDGFSWVITLDQDSIIPNGMIESFVRTIENSHDRLGIVCPQVVDKRRIYSKNIAIEGEEFVNKAITSASCTSIDAWNQVGGFDEWLFIDLVDNEFCKRLIASDFKILRLNEWPLDQEFGNITPKSTKKQEFWFKLSQITHIKNIAKLSYNKYVSPFRVYYVERNIIYINRKLRKYGKVGYDSFNCKSYLGFVISYTLPSLLRAQNKFKVLSAIIRGTRDGLKAHPKTWIAPQDKR